MAVGRRPIHAAALSCFLFVLMAASASAQPIIRGFAELHSHEFANFAFGGWAVTGSPYGPASVELSERKDTHHSWRHLTDVMGGFLAGYSGPINYGNDGAPSYGGWPAFFEVSHQKVHQDFLYRAVRGGLRLMVMYAVDSALLCKSVDHPSDYNCDDVMTPIYRQLYGAYAMQDYIDAQWGGPGRGWYRIVTTPAQARSVMQQGKLAVILGVETSYLFHCVGTPCDWEVPLKDLWNLGVRAFFPMHHGQNAFGSPSYFRSPLQIPSDRAREVLADPLNAIANAVMMPRGAFPYLLLTEPCPEYELKSCGRFGLTPTGMSFVERLMQLGAIIDVDHMSNRSFSDTLDIAERNSYPVIASHAGFNGIDRGSQSHEGQLTDVELGRIRDVGGMIGLVTNQGGLAEIPTYRRPYAPSIEHVCGNTTESFAQAYYYALDHGRGIPIALGSDFNGPLRQVGPRFGGLRCNGGWNPYAKHNGKRLVYPYIAGASGASMPKFTIGSRVFDFNEDGLPHAGLLPDMLADLQNVGVHPVDLEPLYTSADGFLKMWERIEAAKGAVPDGFETTDLNATPWTVYAPADGFEAATTDQRQHLGSRSLVLRSGVGLVYRDFVGLVPGQSYLVTAWVSGDAPATLSVHDTLGGHSMETAPFTPGTGWTRLSLLFTANATKALRVHLVRGVGTGQVYWDDVRTVEAPPNGGFERGSLGIWQAFNTEDGQYEPFVAADHGRTGKYGAAQVLNSIIFQDMDGLTPGVTYVISGWASTVAGFAPHGVLWAHNTLEGNVRSAPVAPGASWQLVSLLYTADSTGKVRIHLARDGGAGPLLWDDVTITKGVPNGGGELGTDGWWTYSTTDPSFKLSTASVRHSGNASLRESGPGVAWQDLPGLAPGRSYVLSAWLSASNGATVRAELSAHDTQGANFAQAFITPAAAWQPLKLTFVASQTGSIRVQLVRHAGAGDVYWDDVEVSEAAPPHLNRLAYSPPTNRWFNQNLTLLGGAGPPLAGSAVTSFNNVTGEHVFYVGEGQHVYQIFGPAGGPWSTQDVTSLASGVNAARDTRLASMDNTAGEHVFYVGASGHVHQLFYSRQTNGWFDQDLTVLASAVGPRPGTPLAAVNNASGEHLFFVAENDHVFELQYSSNASKWIARDVSSEASAAAVADGSGLAVFWNVTGIHVFFTAATGHIWQTIFDSSRWVAQDLSALAAAPLALPATSLTAFDNTAGEHVAYVAQDSRMHQLLYSRQTNRWFDQDLTAVAGAPLPALDSVLASFSNQAEHVVFVGDDGRVRQLIYSQGSNTWSVQDLTAFGGGPSATPWRGVDAFASSAGEQVFYVSPEPPAPRAAPPSTNIRVVR